MIQRRQTVFLLVAMLLITSVLFMPFIKNDFIIFDSFKLKQLNVENPNIVDAYPIGIYVILLAVMHFISIFLFKKRPLQMRITIFALLLSIGFYALLFFYYIQTKDTFGIEPSMFSYSLITPLLAAIFDFMAFKGIQRDEILIRAADRLR